MFLLFLYASVSHVCVKSHLVLSPPGDFFVKSDFLKQINCSGYFKREKVKWIE